MLKKIPVLDSCTISGFKGDELLVDHLGDYLHKHQKLVFPHRHNFYHLVFFTQGSGTHTIDFRQYQVEPRQLYFMVPGQVHSWEFSKDTEGYVINFSRDFFQSFLLRADFLNSFTFFSGHVTDGVICIPAGLEIEIKELMYKVYEQYNTPGTLQKDMISVLLLYLFMRVEQQLIPHEKQLLPVYNYTLLKNFQQLIEKNFAQIRLPKDYADLLYITPNHLNALCKEFLGMQAGEVIRNRVLLEAKRMLVSQDVTITEIAGELNFNDNSYFTKFFKKQTGVTPEEFRKKNA